MSDDEAQKALKALRKDYGHVYHPPEGIDEATEVSMALAWFCDWGFTSEQHECSDMNILRLLLEAGADVHYDHDLALHTMVGRAYKVRPIQPIKELLDHGADMFATGGTERIGNEPRLSALDYAAKRTHEEPDEMRGIIPQFAEAWRDALIAEASDDQLYPKGTHVLDHHPALVKKLAAAVGTEDYKYIPEVVTTSMQLLCAMGMPLTQENICPLITPKNNQSFRQLAESTRCYDQTKCQNAVDMFRDVESSLIIPATVLLSQDHAKTLHPHFYNHYNKSIKNMKEQLTQLSVKTVMKGKNVEDILGLSEAWHSPHYVMPTELKPMLGTSQWYPLAEDLALPSGYKVVCRTGGKELQAESDALNHCVGRSSHYASECMTGKTHILSVIDPKGSPISTIEMRLGDTDVPTIGKVIIPNEKRDLHIIQHRASGNGVPPSKAQQAFEEWKNRVENGTLKLNLAQLGETMASKLRNSGKYSYLELNLGFPVTSEHMERIFQHYRGTLERKGLRGVIYNTANGEFEDNRRNHLINGQYHAVDEQGKKTGASVKREELTFDQWLEASGTKLEIDTILKENEKQLKSARYCGFGC